MGTAFYYLKAEFPKKLKKKEKTAITNFFKKGPEAETFWGDHRYMKSEEFWPEFEKLFPIITLMMKACGLYGKDNNNGLSGTLNFNQGGVEDLVLEDTTLFYHAEVWHFATWDGLANFLQTHFGAINVKWMSDESLDYFQLLDAEENEQIIKNLLSQKDILPTLMGIDPVLDRKISQILL